KTRKIDDWAQAEINAAPGAYAEITVSGYGLRILGVGSGGELGRKWKIPKATNGAAIEVYRRTNRYITISGAQIAGGDQLCNIDAVLDDIAKRYDTKTEPKKPTQNAAKHCYSADIDDLIRNGAPKGFRSEKFFSVVCSLAKDGRSVETITQILDGHPGGIAAKYLKRLGREVERCYRKWQIRNPKQAAHATTPEWPDKTPDNKPKRTYRNARLAIEALGIACSYDEFHDRMVVGGHEINRWAGELSDAV